MYDRCESLPAIIRASTVKLASRTNIQVCIKRLYALLSLETVKAVHLDHAKEVKARLHIEGISQWVYTKSKISGRRVRLISVNI